MDNIIAVVGLLVALPGIYFFTGSFLKYEMNLLSRVEIFIPPPEVMIGGLLLAILLNFFSCLCPRSANVRGTLTTRLVKPKIWNAFIISIAVVFLILLIGYILIENIAESTPMVIDISKYTGQNI
jgi:hypothetical protein